MLFRDPNKYITFEVDYLFIINIDQLIWQFYQLSII